MMTPTDFMRSFISQSWLEDEIEGSIRQLAGTESQTTQTGGETAEGKEEEVNKNVTPEEAFKAVTVEGVSCILSWQASNGCAAKDV